MSMLLEWPSTGAVCRNRIPDVSVLMTVYNTGRYLPEAIESVLTQQTTRTWELILVDDGSTDGSLQIAQSYAFRFPQCIRVLQHEGGRNRGISCSRNLALAHAAASYCAFLDSDDVFLPHHLETQCCLLDALPEVAMVYAGAERWVHFDRPFNEAAAGRAWWGRNYLPPLVPAGERAGLLAPGVLLQWFFENESMVPCICTVLVRTAAARAVSGFCDDFRGLYDDQAFHAKIAQRYRIYANDVCIARYRQHPDSCCARGEREKADRFRENDRFHNFLQTL